MRRPIRHVGQRRSGLVLLGASTILLAAAGETMWHANANATQGRWAGPVLAVAAAGAESAGVAEATASASVTTEVAQAPAWNTQFRPFVLVRIPYDPSIFPDGGEVLGVSNNGSGGNAIAVGYLRDDPTAAPQPFMFTAATNTTTMLDMDDGDYDYGAATSISPDGEHIAGWAYHSASSKARAVVWEAPNYLIDDSLSPSTDSLWHAVNNGGVPAGAYTVSSHLESVVGNGAPGYPFYGAEGESTDINATGFVSGWYKHSSGNSHGYRWHSSAGVLDLHPSGYGSASGANCINDTLHIGGWVTNSYGSHIPTHWSPMSTEIYQSTLLGNGNAASYEVVAINSNKEMLINRVDNIPGIALWTNNSSANVAYLIDTEWGVQGEQHLILTPNPDDSIYDGHCLNDDLWIGGSYLVHGEGLPRPCLAIPYDINNNGVPDYREIIESGHGGYGSRYVADHGGFEWLIDADENIGFAYGSHSGMRMGLNRPGYSDAYTDDIAYTQVVRLPLGLHNPDFVTGTIGDDEYYVNGIVYTGGTSQCNPFQTGLNNWREGREIILTLRSNLDDSDPDHDYLPTAPNVDLGEGVTKTHLLANLHRFSYNFSRCVDWIQLGNEAFSSADQSSFYGGHGGYKIWAEEVGDCWTTGNDPREFEEITCPIPAIEAVQAWHYEQMWSILEGSALAGRPLRIVGPAVPLDTIYNFVSEDTTTGWKVIDRTAKWCNDYQVWFDMHARYLVQQHVETARYYLRDNPGNPTWQYPFHAVCLEWAPRLDVTHNWWTDNNGLNALRFDKFLNMPDCNDDPGITWETYIDGWQNAQFYNDADFGMANVAYYLWYDGFTVICYGSTLQLPESDPLYDLAALRAQNVCDSYITTQYKFTELKGHYQSAADDYDIEDFDPHQNACSACGGN